MAQKTGPETEDSAEKAYAAAAEAAGEQPAVEFPSKAKRGPKPRVMAAPEPTEDEASNSAVAKPVPLPAAPAIPARPAVTAAVAQPVRKPPAARKPVKTVLPAPTKKVRAAVPPAARPVAEKPITDEKIPSISQLKDKIMATQSTDFTQSSAYAPGADFTSGFKTVIADAQEKAKAAFEKGSSAFGEVSEFAKGNVEAAVESGKILASGLQEIGSTYVSESKSAFETLTADFKDLAAVKTPVDFFKLQGELARRNFDNAVAFGSKNSEAVLKLANEAFAPLSSRVNLAVDKIKQSA